MTLFVFRILFIVLVYAVEAISVTRNARLDSAALSETKEDGALDHHELWSHRHNDVQPELFELHLDTALQHLGLCEAANQVDVVDRIFSNELLDLFNDLADDLLEERRHLKH